MTTTTIELVKAHLKKRVEKLRGELNDMYENHMANSPQWINAEARLMTVLEIQDLIVAVYDL